MSKLNKELYTCTLNPGFILMDKVKYICQIEGDHSTKLRKSSFIKMLREKYDLSEDEYYNIVVHGDINYINPCKQCGGPTRRYGGLLSRYREFCSISCTATNTNLRTAAEGTNPFQDRDFIKRNLPKAIEGTKKRLKELASKGEHPFQKQWVIDKHSSINSKRLTELSKESKNPFQSEEFRKAQSIRSYKRGKELSSKKELPYQQPFSQANSSMSRYSGIKLDCYLYITKDNLVKVGISKDYKNRVSKDYPKLGSSHRILNHEDNKYSILLEKEIKEIFCIKGTENFDYSLLHKVISYVKDFKLKHGIK